MHVRALVILAACLGLPVLASAQSLRLPELSDLKKQATESVTVTLGPEVLDFVSAFPDGDDPDMARIRKAFQEIKSVTVRSFKFDTDVRPGAELDDLRRQLNTPEFSPLVQVHDRGKSEDVNIYLAYSGRVVRELVIMAVSPREITLVDVAGTLEPSRIAELRGAFEHRGHATVQID